MCSRYAKVFPAMCQAIDHRRATNKAQVGARSACKGDDDQGQSLVGFGAHSTMTRQALFQSTKEEHRAYVNSIIKHPVTHPGGQLDKLKRYLTKELDKERAEDLALVQCLDNIEKANTVEGILY